MVKQRRKRNWALMLKLSLRFAKEYLKALCKMRKHYTGIEIQKSKKLTIIQRALWTSLIIEVGRLFDTYKSKDKNERVISFKKLNLYEKEVDNIFKEKIIQRIRTTRNTFTAHLDEKADDIISVPEICNSNLDDLLEKLSKLQIETARVTEEGQRAVIILNRIL